MANYQETTGEGSTWKRCLVVSITNPVNGPKTVHFMEEIAARVGTVAIGSGSTDGIHENADDLTKVIPLRNPETGELTGESLTYGDVYVALYSAYMQAALARDAANVPEPTPEPTPGP